MSYMKEHVRQLNEERAMTLPKDFTVTTRDECEAFVEEEIARNRAPGGLYTEADMRYIARMCYREGRISALNEHINYLRQTAESQR